MALDILVGTEHCKCVRYASLLQFSPYTTPSIYIYTFLQLSNNPALHNGLGKHLGDIHGSLSEILVEFFKALYAFENLYSMAMTFTKLSMSVFAHPLRHEARLCLRNAGVVSFPCIVSFLTDNFGGASTVVTD